MVRCTTAPRQLMSTPIPNATVATTMRICIVGAFSGESRGGTYGGELGLQGGAHHTPARSGLSLHEGLVLSLTFPSAKSRCTANLCSMGFPAWYEAALRLATFMAWAASSAWAYELTTRPAHITT